MNRPPVRLFIAGLLSALALTGCETGPGTAYPSAEATAGQGRDISTLALGRKIYTTTCTECHVARPVAEFSASQWTQIVEVMAPRAGLKPSDRAALEAYLVAAREASPRG